MSLQSKDKKCQEDISGSSYPGLFLNQLMQQSRTQGGLQCAIPQYMANRHTAMGNGLLAVAVQQQLVASFVSPNLPLLQPLGLASQQSLVNDLSSTHSMLPRTTRGAVVQGNPSPTNLSLLSMARRQSIDLQRDAKSSKNSQASVVEACTRVPTTQIPCQARGMSTDHNSLTAYFEITSDATHGQHLFCSHQACRAAGVKFRYCLYCKKPVTKQNFRSRHLHADLEKPICSTKSSPTEEKSNQSKDNPGQVLPPFRTPDACYDRLSNVAMQKPQHVESDSVQSVNFGVLGKTIVGNKTGNTKKRKQETNSSVSLSLAPGFDQALGVAARRRRWSSLLRERPPELSAINGWLSKVISVSDSSVPWKFTDEPLNIAKVNVGCSVQQQSQWDLLLSQRPNKEESGITEWLVKVLQVSCPEFKTDVLLSGRADNSASSLADGSKKPKSIPMTGALVHNTHSSDGTEPIKRLKTAAKKIGK